MKLNQINLFVLKPVCASLGMLSLSAEKLMLTTIGVESRGMHLDQRLSADDVTLGPAVGIMQMESPTHESVYHDFLNYPKRRKIRTAVDSFACEGMDKFEQMAGNLYYAIAIGRINYWRRPEVLPHPDDIDGLWLYYKEFWNSYLGVTTRAQWDEAYDTLVAPLFND